MKTDKILTAFELQDENLENVYGGANNFTVHFTIFRCSNEKCGKVWPIYGNCMGTGPRICTKCRQVTFNPVLYVPPKK